MSRLVSDKCDFYIKIPMVGHVNSLNASVAASLMMYEDLALHYQLQLLMTYQLLSLYNLLRYSLLYQRPKNRCFLIHHKNG
jgi:hypothetical protein